MPKSELVLVALLCTDVVVGALRYTNVGVRSLLTNQLVGALLIGALIALLSILVLVGALLSIHVLVGVLLRVHVLSGRSRKGLKDTL